jgi:hypothetical protein
MLGFVRFFGLKGGWEFIDFYSVSIGFPGPELNKKYYR